MITSARRTRGAVDPYSVTYDTFSHTATVVSITGVGGQTGATVGTVDVRNTTHTNAGTYAADYWTFTGTANYNNIAATTITDQIDKANATINVTPYHVTYDLTRTRRPTRLLAWGRTRRRQAAAST
jgi:hypothetical protein